MLVFPSHLIKLEICDFALMQVSCEQKWHRWAGTNFDQPVRASVKQAFRFGQSVARQLRDCMVCGDAKGNRSITMWNRKIFSNLSGPAASDPTPPAHAIKLVEARVASVIGKATNQDVSAQLEQDTRIEFHVYWWHRPRATSGCQAIELLSAPTPRSMRILLPAMSSFSEQCVATSPRPGELKFTLVGR